MSEMTQRVARAIWLKLSGPEFDECEEAARAAIEAMREPTQAMLDAADMADHKSKSAFPSSEHGDAISASALELWQAMTGAALK